MNENNEQQRDFKVKFSIYTIPENNSCKIAIRNLEALCRKVCSGNYQIEEYNLSERRKIASKKMILAIPTTTRDWPKPIVRVIGDLSETQKVIDLFFGDLTMVSGDKIQITNCKLPASERENN